MTSTVMSFWKNRLVLVTGGAGFIGSHLVTALVECGANVSVVDNLERGRKEVLGDVLAHVKFFDLDLRESGVASGLCDGMDAGYTLPPRREASTTIRVEHMKSSRQTC